MSIGAQYIKVMSENLQQAATQMIPIHVSEGQLRQSVTAASGCRAPHDSGPEALRLGYRLACGCTKNVLETGWHEVGCEVVGAHLCRPAMKQQRVARPSPLVVFEA